MEVMKGYKQTEIGVIPNDWIINEVSKIATINGRVGWKGYTKKDLVNIGPYAIGAKHIDKNNKLDLSDPTCLSMDKYLESPEIMVFKDDLLIVQRGTIGKLVLIEKEIGNATINPSMLILRSKEIPSNYIYYYFISKDGQSQIILDTSSTGVPMITQKQVLNFKIPFPPTKAEQTAIANALSDTDTWINSLEQLLTKKHQIKKGAMQELLQPKEGWKLVNLSENFTLKARIGWHGLTTSEYLKSGDYVLVTGTDFKNGFIDWDNCVFVEKLRFDQDKNIQLKEKDVLVTKDGTIGKVAFINKLSIPTTLNSGVFVVRPKKGFNNQFLYYILMSFHFDKFLEKITAGSTIVHLYQKDFMHFNFPVPSLSEQTRIATILSDMDDEVALLETKLYKAKQIKQGMMQKLLTGRIRLV